MRFTNLLSTIIILALVLVQGCLAGDNEVSEDADGNLPPGYVRSGNALNSNGHVEAGSLSLQADYCIQNGLYDQAIKLCQRAIDKNDDDADIHMMYADALEHKLRKQKQKDPNLFMAAVHEWLIVARNEKGEERGITNKSGLSLPGMQKWYEDDERSIPAIHHLVGLVGYAPKMRETDKKYLQRVEQQCQNMVKGTIVEKPSSEAKSIGTGTSKDPNAISH